MEAVFYSIKILHPGYFPACRSKKEIWHPKNKGVKINKIQRIKGEKNYGKSKFRKTGGINRKGKGSL